MKQAVIYVRVSSREQKEEGYSIPAQKKLLWEYARVNDFQVAKEFEDDETAKSAGRSGFGEMVEFLKSNKKVDTLLVEKTDRLYRNFKDYVIIDELGIAVILVKENEKIGKDASSHQKFIHGIKLLMAKNYIDNLSEEVKKGLRQKAESGIFPCSTPPLGYKLERVNNKSVLIIDEKNKDLIVNMFNWYATGLYSLLDLYHKIKDEGLLIIANIPSNSKVETLTKSSIQRILRNPVYYGDFFWKGEIHKGSHEPIISKQLWDKVQANLDGFKNKKMLSKYNTLDFVFKGLMTCGQCGRHISGVRKIKPSGKEYVYYNCTKYETNCSQKPVKESDLNKQVKNKLDGLKLPSHETVLYVAEGLKQSLYVKRNTEDKTREALEAEKRRLEQGLDTLYEDRLDTTITKDFYSQKASEYEAKITDLTEKINHYTKANIDYYKTGIDILELANMAGFLYENANSDEKQKLLNFLLWNSTLKDKNLAITYKKPFDRVYQRAQCCDWRGRWDSNPQPHARQACALAN
jgi:site-specific DNA recombinase